MIQNRVFIRSIFVVSVACVLLVIISLLASARALPPRPTPEPTAVPTAEPTPTPIAQPVSPSRPEGSSIELRAQFPQTWPWAEVHWQALWTVVQWQDGWDNWRDVEGWQGELEEIAVSEGGDAQCAVGSRVWWVTKTDLGKGPFRWQVYRGKDDALLATSDPFYLPDASDQTRAVEVSLAP